MQVYIKNQLIQNLFQKKNYNEDTKEITKKLLNNMYKIGDHSLLMNETDRTSVALLFHENIIDLFKNNNKKFDFKFNEKKILQEVIQILKNNQIVSLISDAGTPSISDPGKVLVNACIKENILIVPGGKVIIFFSSMLLGDDDREILYPNPGFPIYESAIRFSGAKPVPYPLRENVGFSFSAEDILDKINKKTSYIPCCLNYNKS